MSKIRSFLIKRIAGNHPVVMNVDLTHMTGYISAKSNNGTTVGA